ncbi:ATP phosphoribosyltransferase regulatory subunit [Lachnoclostridium sp. Marseille-P6806]|uniref:ATP phosphoribosyltransferase regulatory subunit n=1 Tax=Lachnoclostridium sp. Marseille-P6806 TaxID=2364793 RepID=UPI001030DD3F|nr:ATP phosphoribosyltransferase regulatory subunit [Lachnoclostridium sp. Marseille-P6806]
MNRQEEERALLHTPEGVRDVYGKEWKEKRAVMSRILREMTLYGYEELQTPSFEFSDVFSREIGTTPSRELYRFFDREGETLSLRPDFTPSCARCAAKYYMEESGPIRFCYQGSAFLNRSSLQGKLRESTQTGVELIGDGSVFADAEAIALLIHALQSAGLRNFCVSIGNADYFRGVWEAAGLDGTTEAALRELISGKNFFAAEKLLEEAGVAGEERERLLRGSDFIGTAETLDEAAASADNPRSQRAVERLRAVCRVLREYGFDEELRFDLSMLSNYNYYTGIIFRGFTYGVGDAVASGGRYDTLLARFGKAAPAIGFMIPVDTLLEALRRQRISVPVPGEAVRLLYTEETFSEKLREAEKLRAGGQPVVLEPAH